MVGHTLGVGRGTFNYQVKQQLRDTGWDIVGQRGLTANASLSWSPSLQQCPQLLVVEYEYAMVSPDWSGVVAAVVVTPDGAVVLSVTTVVVTTDGVVVAAVVVTPDGTVVLSVTAVVVTPDGAVVTPVS